MTGAGHKCLYLLKSQAALALLLAYCLLLPPQVRADTPVTAVLFPEIREPFRSVFTTIADGVSEALDGQVVVRALGNDDSADEIGAWLRERGIRATVVLGSRGQELSDKLSATTPVVIGGIHMSSSMLDGAYHGIVLNPDPERLFQRLRSLAPGVKRVHIVYHRQREQWLVDSSIEAAGRAGITLNPVPVDRLQDAANSYLEVLRSQKSGSEALWLSQDSAVLDEQAVLPMILKEAWDRKLIVFSSNPSHVRKGVLFALYPDNHGMGRSLGKLSLELHERLEHNQAPAPSGMRSLADLLTAFNVRTAGRIGIRYSRDDLSNFDLVFPPL
jgi:putative tryptophan/tyrosine transport system substrate-binding protein